AHNRVEYCLQAGRGRWLRLYRERHLRLAGLGGLLALLAFRLSGLSRLAFSLFAFGFGGLRRLGGLGLVLGLGRLLGLLFVLISHRSLLPNVSRRAPCGHRCRSSRRCASACRPWDRRLQCWRGEPAAPWR